MFPERLLLVRKVKLLGLFATALLVLLTLGLMVIVYFNEKRQEVLATIPLYHALQSEAPQTVAARYGYDLPEKNAVENLLAGAEPLLIDAQIRGSFYSGDIALYNTRSGTLSLFKIGDETIALLNPSPPRHHRWIIAAVFALLLAALALLYRFIVGAIRPLETLRAQIETYNRTRRLEGAPIDRTDEAGILAETFYRLVRQNEINRRNRNLFTRNIIHELKTPLMQTRLAAAAEGVPEPAAEAIAVSVGRQDALLNELLEIENVLGDAMQPHPETLYLPDLIDDVLEQLGVDIDGTVVCRNIGQTLRCDYRMLFLVVKNLADNAVKYRTGSKPVQILFDTGSLKVINAGAPFTKADDYYFEAFHRAGASRAGLGLGLYIVNELCRTLSLDLSHRFEQGHHIFSVAFAESMIEDFSHDGGRTENSRAETAFTSPSSRLR